MNTPSFLSGLCIGCATTAFVSGQQDWVIWVTGSLICVMWLAWKEGTKGMKR